MNKDQLHSVAKAMVAPGKGILAADESTSTIKKRFDDIKVENTEDNRRDYREFMFRSAKAMKEHISGVILFDETIRQTAKDGTPLVKIIEEMGSLPGIKVDAVGASDAGLPGRDDHRGSRRPAQADEGILRPRRPLREMARGDRHRRRPADLGRGARQHAGAGPLRGDLPAGRHRADRRARGDDDRRPWTREDLRGHRVGAAHALRGAVLPPRVPGGLDPQAEHGRAGRGREEGVARAGRRGDDPPVQAHRAGGGAGHRVPVRRPVRRRGDRQPRCDRQARPAALEHHLLLRPRAAGTPPSTPGPARRSRKPPVRPPSPIAPA